MCHDEDGWCQIPINSFLLEAYEKFPDCWGQWRQRECWEAVSSTHCFHLSAFGENTKLITLRLAIRGLICKWLEKARCCLNACWYERAPSGFFFGGEANSLAHGSGCTVGGPRTLCLFIKGATCLKGLRTPMLKSVDQNTTLNHWQNNTLDDRLNA